MRTTRKSDAAVFARKRVAFVQHRSERMNASLFSRRSMSGHCTSCGKPAADKFATTSSTVFWSR
jgi:hypothetical protein